MNADDPIGCIVSGQAGEKRGFSPDHLFVRRISAGSKVRHPIVPAINVNWLT